MLSMGGHVVITAANGAEALERVHEQKPDLIVTDLMMPVMSGKDLILNLKADPETAKIPIVVLSAFADADITDADVVMRKPFMQADLLASVEGLIGA
jgi:CheY-like chemotaxis protein